MKIILRKIISDNYNIHLNLKFSSRRVDGLLLQDSELDLDGRNRDSISSGGEGRSFWLSKRIIGPAPLHIGNFVFFLSGDNANLLRSIY